MPLDKPVRQLQPASLATSLCVASPKWPVVCRQSEPSANLHAARPQFRSPIHAVYPTAHPLRPVSRSPYRHCLRVAPLAVDTAAVMTHEASEFFLTLMGFGMTACLADGTARGMRQVFATLSTIAASYWVVLLMALEPDGLVTTAPLRDRGGSLQQVVHGQLAALHGQLGALQTGLSSANTAAAAIALAMYETAAEPIVRFAEGSIAAAVGIASAAARQAPAIPAVAVPTASVGGQPRGVAREEAMAGGALEAAPPSATPREAPATNQMQCLHDENAALLCWPASEGMLAAQLPAKLEWVAPRQAVAAVTKLSVRTLASATDGVQQLAAGPAPAAAMDAPNGTDVNAPNNGTDVNAPSNGTDVKPGKRFEQAAEVGKLACVCSWGSSQEYAGLGWMT